ncbi:hypothetical protein QC823_14225 [Halomonas vilamensis]|uniref:Uncharacterized protein n=1 Tax=Vreelandella vilamensis TaxID=531309 RepID=A0ABU1H8U5_9GAMM|nr:hypothetical protein [Halomonas vilamensis]MDR5900137.1 hypothetical protein [Halomonas vilamensis]
MKKSNGYLLAAMLLIPSVITLASSETLSLEALLEEVRSEDYAIPDAKSIGQAQAGFRYWLAADDRLEAAHSFESPGFDTLGLAPVELAEPGFVALIEQADTRDGRGLFAARAEGGTPLLIQAPHQYYDLRTGTLARQLFLESDAMAAAWNTTHRYHSDDTDLVHIGDSYLHALSRAFADIHPEGRILQLHGFSTAKRDSYAGRSAQAILSDGTRYPSRALAQLAACLADRLDIRALLYPRDVRELGATTNTLAADLHRRNFDGFVHLELNPDLRKRLVRDKDARNILIQCVAETSS